MKRNTGVVMQLNKQHAFIMTNSGEFLKLKLNKTSPKIGEVYTGEVAQDTPFYKYALTAATLAFLVLFGSSAYAYYTPVASVIVNINPSIKLDLNKWNRIIKSTALNDDGKKVLSELKVNNKTLDDGLNSIVNQAKKDNFINVEYIESGKTISVDINSNKPIKDFNLSKFEDNIKSGNINLKITTSENNNTYDKLDISTSHDSKPKKSDKDTNNNINNNNNNNNNNNKQETNSNEHGKDKNDNKHDKDKNNKNNSSNLFPSSDNINDSDKSTSSNSNNIYSRGNSNYQTNNNKNNSDNKDNNDNGDNKKDGHKD